MPSKNDFLENLNELLEKQSSDSDFGILNICQHLAISRTQLHRKISASTGLSTSIYLRNFRLNTAYELLQTTNWSISQITYTSGFSNMAYFSRCFKEKYGLSPSSIRKK